jgi:hypothetical protein
VGRLIYRVPGEAGFEPEEKRHFKQRWSCGAKLSRNAATMGFTIGRNLSTACLADSSARSRPSVSASSPTAEILCVTCSGELTRSGRHSLSKHLASSAADYLPRSTRRALTCLVQGFEEVCSRRQQPQPCFRRRNCPHQLEAVYDPPRSFGCMRYYPDGHSLHGSAVTMRVERGFPGGDLDRVNKDA